ncbi:MAG: pyruvate ferredoxin oxidoreductase [Planctomycetota bacterium]|nr:MAG: pyruvate ferredoxin oxidoreductase [Planctomycetota bacterium]
MSATNGAGSGPRDTSANDVPSGDSRGAASPSRERRTRVLVVGVGGQGVLTVARWLGRAAQTAGVPVVIGQLHGMSQRGGSVETSVLFGPGSSSFIPSGGAHVVLGLEPMEVLRAKQRVGPDTHLIVNTGRVVPCTLSFAGEPYPDVSAMLAAVAGLGRELVTVEGSSLAHALGEPRVLSTLMTGALIGSGRVPLGRDEVWAAIESRCPPRLLEVNRQAFEAGLDATRRATPSGGGGGGCGCGAGCS